MYLPIVKEYEWINLNEEKDPNKFGEALRGFCFIGNLSETGYYSINLIFKKINSGPIFEEVKKILCPEFENSLYVYYYKNDIIKPIEIVCAWYWDGNGVLYFKYNNIKIINTDCKCNNYWKWIK